MDSYGGSVHARTRIREGFAKSLAEVRASKGRGDRGEVAAAEAAVKAEPRRCIRFGDAGSATVAAAGRGYQGGRFETPWLVQVVTDVDADLALYTKETFLRSIHTVDVMHVIEYLYQVGECLYPEGSPNLLAFVTALKERLYGGKQQQLVAELWRRRRDLPLIDPDMRAQPASRKRGVVVGSLNVEQSRLYCMQYS